MTFNNTPRIASCILTLFGFTTLLGAQPNWTNRAFDELRL
jgi:hypothetical protein